MRFLRALRTIVAALAVGLSASAAMAQASQTRAQLESYVSTNIGPNGVGAVTGTIMQRALLNQAASTFTLQDTITEGLWGCAGPSACAPSSLTTIPANVSANFGFNMLGADNPTFSLGVNIVNPSAPFLYMNNEAPTIPTDAHAWTNTIADSDGSFHFKTINDAGTVEQDWLIVARTGLNATLADFVIPVSMPAVTTPSLNVVGPSNPFFYIDNSSLNGGANLGAWDMTVLNTTGTLQFNALGDTSGSNAWMSVTRSGFVPQLVTITPPLADISSITGDTAGATWVNTLLPGSLGHTPMMAISTTSANYSAGLFATKTSLNTSVGQSLIGATFLNWADNTTVGNLALTWGFYAETVVAPSSTFLQAFGGEISSANQKANSGVEDPYTPNPASLVVGTRYSAGIAASAFNASAAIDVVPNGAKYWAGFIIDPAALDTTSGYADAYATGVNAGLSFYSAASTRAVDIFLNDPGAGINAEQMIFGNNVLDIYINGGAYHALGITSTSVAIGGGGGITASGPGGALTAVAYSSVVGSANGGSGVANALPFITVKVGTTVNFNSIADTSFSAPLPTGATGYIVNFLRVYNCSAAITTAQFGVFSAASGGGFALVPTVTGTNTATGPNAANSAQNASSAVSWSGTTSLFFHVSVAQGSAATCAVDFSYAPIQ